MITGMTFPLKPCLLEVAYGRENWKTFAQKNKGMHEKQEGKMGYVSESQSKPQY